MCGGTDGALEPQIACRRSGILLAAAEVPCFSEFEVRPECDSFKKSRGANVLSGMNLGVFLEALAPMVGRTLEIPLGFGAHAHRVLKFGRFARNIRSAEVRRCEPSHLIRLANCSGAALNVRRSVKWGSRGGSHAALLTRVPRCLTGILGPSLPSPRTGRARTAKRPKESARVRPTCPRGAVRERVQALLIPGVRNGDHRLGFEQELVDQRVEL